MERFDSRDWNCLRIAQWLFMTATIMVSSCVTPTKISPKIVPAVLGGYFSQCAPSDGALTVKHFDQGTLSGSLDVEWVAEGTGDWQVMSFDPVGSPILDIHIQDNKVVFKGLMEDKAPSIDIDEQGFLVVDGHQIGIRKQEVPCFLGQTLPNSWMTQLTQFDQQGGVATFRFHDDIRSIITNVVGMPENPLKICSAVKWSNALGLVTTAVEWCYFPRSRKSVMKLEEGQRLSWVGQDG